MSIIDYCCLINVVIIILIILISVGVTAPQQADIENKKVLESLRAETPDKANVPAGSRMVSGEQWAKLQEEVISP